ncbi:hypothetical protein [Jannaschia rubra]|uniref:Heat induced stress protein YflT n=1 Tax=Jannaschia rubra TaxID=282197 RepID=A0A0M6XNH3_9RHOB|nr:hypothetical protein [Jannaschia rubra]CTQ32137.1 hypothetical protein JAN5088_00900 [Jannaschia rubra]SFG36741.1 hypothetical protein SAMN04488517_10493 [Jannaschia rubra]
MHRNVTAIYRTHAVADQVRRELTEAGLLGTHVKVVPDRDDALAAGTHRDEASYRTDLDHLGLPEDDQHTYEQAVRRGDYIVSARVDDDDDTSNLDRVKEIMRHPEAQSFDTLNDEFVDTPRSRHMAETNVVRGRRDTEYDYGDESVRGYRYDKPYNP